MTLRCEGALKVFMAVPQNAQGPMHSRLESSGSLISSKCLQKLNALADICFTVLGMRIYLMELCAKDSSLITSRSSGNVTQRRSVQWLHTASPSLTDNGNTIFWMLEFSKALFPISNMPGFTLTWLIVRLLLNTFLRKLRIVVGKEKALVLPGSDQICFMALYNTAHCTEIDASPSRY